jgi:hypothetical protein
MAFRLEEATIDDLHAAIRAGEITCVQVVQHYLEAPDPAAGLRPLAAAVMILGWRTT